MNKIVGLTLALLLNFQLEAQITEKYHRVRIDLRGRAIQDIEKLGIPADHGVYEPGRSFSTDISESELNLLKQAGFSTQIQVADIQEWYRSGRPLPPQAAARAGACDQAADSGPIYPTPANYTYGSMGGYHTLDEMLAVLDDMRAKFPQLITARAILSDTLATHEGRPIWYVKISRQADVDENEPEVLYTALHHAREPNGLSQMLFFMWQLLERYPTDPEVQYILDHAELYFVPCLNPDGYVYNENIEPNGGGMWRKNLRDNGNGTFGVDLNRNYGYQWGFDNAGSSPNPGSAVYRGPGPFSEPETQMVRDFCLAHNFRLAFNYHTFGNLLIYPWAYSDTPAEEGFRHFGRVLSRYNRYLTGTALETVGYPVNGSSDDWMFGGADAFSFTPEVGPGSFGFWPPKDTIDGLNKANAWSNRVLALCALRYGEAQDADNGDFNLANPRLPVRFRRLGIEPGPITLSLTPLSANIASVSGPIVLDIPLFALQDTAFQIAFAPGTQSGEEARLLLQVDNGDLVFSDTLVKVLLGPAIPLANDPANDLNGWPVAAGWGVTQEHFKTAPSSFTDSPGAVYAPSAASELVAAPLALPAGAANILLRFWTRWEIEPRYDYAVAQAVFQDGSFKNLCGLYTKPGSDAQQAGEPVYDGFQSDWVQECIDLTPYAGQTIALRFALFSDEFQEFDGIYVDDLEISYAESGFVQALSLAAAGTRLLPIRPNPATDQVTVSWIRGADMPASGTLTVVNALGKTVYNEKINLAGAPQMVLQTASWPAGVYSCYLEAGSAISAAQKITIVR
jgi:hypothetical protein